MTTKFSRTGFTSPLGKLDSELPKIKVPEALQLSVMQSAHESGLSVSEYIREVMMIQEFGADVVASMYQRRTQRIARKGVEMGDEE